MKFAPFILSFSFLCCFMAELSAYSILTKTQNQIGKTVEIKEIVPEKSEEQAVNLETPIKENEDLAAVYEEPLQNSYYGELGEVLDPGSPDTDVFQAEFAQIRHEGRDCNRLVLVLRNLLPWLLSINEHPRLTSFVESIQDYICFIKENGQENFVRDALLIGKKNGCDYEIRMNLSHPFYNYYDKSLSFEIQIEDESLQEDCLQYVFLLLEKK